MIAPENHNGVVCIWALVQGVEHPAKHGVGITDIGKVAMNGIIPCIQGLQFLYDSGTARFHFFDLLGEIIQIIFFEGRELDIFWIVKIKVLLWAVVRVVRSIKPDCEEEWLFMLLF